MPLPTILREITRWHSARQDIRDVSTEERRTTATRQGPEPGPVGWPLQTCQWLLGRKAREGLNNIVRAL